LSQALNSAVSSRIERIFGVSRVKIDPQVGGPETNPGARVTLEQQVTQDVRFTYITNLSESQQQVIQVEWNINPRWSVIAVRDRNGLFGIDLKWRKRFK
jgi:translocation and assembly module TamB